MDKTDGTFPTVAHPTDTTQGRTQGGTQEDKYDLPIHSRARSSLEQDMNPEPNKTHTPSSDSDSGLTPCQPAGKLAGKIAIITGGESGIGRAIAILFALEGARVVISYPREKEEDAQNTKAQVEKNEGEIHLIASDLTQAANCTALVNQVIAALGGIDILVNNAAIRNEKGDIADITYEQWSATSLTNVDPLFHLTNAALPYLSSGAAIVNSASADAYIGTPSRVDYAANKEVVIAFTRALSNQLVKKGIRVNAVAIGPVWPSLVTTGASEQDQKGQDLGSWTPMEQLDEIATSYVFLAGNESTFMSGQTLHPNGGIVVKG
ncbi:NAD(P)-binding protein [Daldinia vernicosa]|uniref:NAD(P)-binding protein n=1 Tax=Daldinia vernicosa TaxID=114800 RepID=UPI00200720DE|nr:NAD(P)-binding protein [Daldinia vernicosa]KAI0849246.1 NAD(P)-binding protein [Daldinia vernicosa]